MSRLTQDWKKKHHSRKKRFFAHYISDFELTFTALATLRLKTGWVIVQYTNCEVRAPKISHTIARVRYCIPVRPLILIWYSLDRRFATCGVTETCSRSRCISVQLGSDNSALCRRRTRKFFKTSSRRGLETFSEDCYDWISLQLHKVRENQSDPGGAFSRWIFRKGNDFWCILISYMLLMLKEVVHAKLYSKVQAKLESNCVSQ